jgi:hypothetical protein
MSATTLYTLPSGKILAVIDDGPNSRLSIFDPNPRPMNKEDEESLDRLTQALLRTKPVQTNINVRKFPRYRGQCQGYREVIA